MLIRILMNEAAQAPVPAAEPGMEEILRVLLEPSNLLKYACAAIFAWAVLGGLRLCRRRPFTALARLIVLFLFFQFLQIGLSLLTLRYRIFAGIGTWLSALIGVLLYTLLFCPFERDAAIVTAAFAYTTITLVIEFGAVLGRTIQMVVEGFDAAWVGYAANVLLLVMAVLIGRHPLRKYYVSVHAVWMNLIACAANTGVAVLFDIYAIHVFERGGNKEILSFVSITLFLLYWVNFTIYVMTFYLCREQARVLDLTTETQINKSAENLMAVTEANLEEYHKINHDIRNQHAYMLALIRKGDYEGLEKYFEELTGTFAESLAPVVDCGNHTLNVILNMELAKATQAGVRLDVKAAPPHELPYRDLDLCKLYTNLIDNSIEACVREKIENPTVKILITVNGDYLFTRIFNPTSQAPSSLEKNLRTSKADKRIHGKGRTIVRSIVKAGGGRIGERIEDGLYITEFMLDLRKKEGTAYGGKA